MKPAQLVPPQSTCQEESFDSARAKMDFLDRLLISLSPAYTAWGKLIDPQSTDLRDREQQLNFYTKLILRIMPMLCGGVTLAFQLTQVFQFIWYHLWILILNNPGITTRSFFSKRLNMQYFITQFKHVPCKIQDWFSICNFLSIFKQVRATIFTLLSVSMEWWTNQNTKIYR